MYALADVTAENPWMAMGRLNLQLVKATEVKTELHATDEVV